MIGGAVALLPCPVGDGSVSCPHGESNLSYRALIPGHHGYSLCILRQRGVWIRVGVVAACDTAAVLAALDSFGGEGVVMCGRVAEVAAYRYSFLDVDGRGRGGGGEGGEYGLGEVGEFFGMFVVISSQDGRAVLSGLYI